MMKWIVFAIGAVALAFGAWWGWFGWSIVQIERGWSALIAGSVIASAGLVLVALAAVMGRIDALCRIVADGQAARAGAAKADATGDTAFAAAAPVATAAALANRGEALPAAAVDAPAPAEAPSGGPDDDIRAKDGSRAQDEAAYPAAVRPPVGPPPPRGSMATAPAPGGAALAGLAGGAMAQPSVAPAERSGKHAEPGLSPGPEPDAEIGSGADAATADAAPLQTAASGAPAPIAAFDDAGLAAPVQVPPRRPLPASIEWPDPPPVMAPASEPPSGPPPDPADGPPEESGAAPSAEVASGASEDGGAGARPVETLTEDAVGVAPSSDPIGGVEDDDWEKELLDIRGARSEQPAAPHGRDAPAHQVARTEPREPASAEIEPSTSELAAEQDAGPERAPETNAAPGLEDPPTAIVDEPIVQEPRAEKPFANEAGAIATGADAASEPSEPSGPPADDDPVVVRARDDAPPAPPSDRTLLRSYESQGVRYFLYTDGSIDAQTPEGAVTFSSLSELRTFIEDRGV